MPLAGLGWSVAKGAAHMRCSQALGKEGVWFSDAKHAVTRHLQNLQFAGLLRCTVSFWDGLQQCGPRGLCQGLLLEGRAQPLPEPQAGGRPKGRLSTGGVAHDLPAACRAQDCLCWPSMRLRRVTDSPGALPHRAGV